MKEKQPYTKTEKFTLGILILIIIASLATIARCFFSIDTMDETYCYSEALTAINGNIPYAYNFTEGAGFSLFVIPFIYIYKIIVPTLSGVVLYMRLCWALIRLALVFCAYKLLRKKHGQLPCIIVCLILSVWHYYSNIMTYNSTSMWGIFMVSLILYSEFDTQLGKKQYAMFFLSGFISAISVFTLPFYGTAVISFIILIFIYSPKESRFKKMVTYCLGGVFEIAIISIGIISRVGVRKLISGIKYFMIYTSWLSDESCGRRLLVFFKTYIWMFVAMLVIFTIAYFLRKNYSDKLYFASTCSLFPSIISAYFLSGKTADLFSWAAVFGTALMFVGILLLVKTPSPLIWFTSLPFILFVILETILSSTSNCLVHNCFAIPCIVAIIISVFDNSENDTKYLLFVYTSLFFICLLFLDTTYTYRDRPLPELNTRVTHGIYKGLYSTEAASRFIPELEDYLRENTNGIDNVAFRDCAPFAYLMYDGSICDLQTWDAMLYYNGMKDGDINLYNYYKNRNQIPLRIIYIDFKRDEKLSIFKHSFQYNKWVESYYALSKEDVVNDLFTVRIYDYQGNFDGDFSQWTTD